MAVNNEATELQFLHKLKSIEPPQWLIPSPSRSELARAGTQQIFSILKPYATKSPFEKLLVDGFDAEQIWQQIDLQLQPVLGLLRREVKRYERNPDDFVKLFGDVRGGEKDLGLENGIENVDEDMWKLEDEDEEEEDEEERREGEESESESDDEEEEDEEKKVGKKGGFEDQFLKVDELEEYLEKDEEREYGVDAPEKKKSKNGKRTEISSEDEEEDEIGLFEGSADEDGDQDVKYDDFFGPKKKKEVKRKFDLIDGPEDSETDDEEVEERDDDKEEELDDDEEEDGVDGMVYVKEQ